MRLPPEVALFGFTNQTDTVYYAGKYPLPLR